MAGVKRVRVAQDEIDSTGGGRAERGYAGSHRPTKLLNFLLASH